MKSFTEFLEEAKTSFEVKAAVKAIKKALKDGDDFDDAFDAVVDDHALSSSDEDELFKLVKKLKK